MDSDHVSEEDFLLDFFGLYGRELGNPDQFFEDNPRKIFDFIKNSTSNKRPAFISVQPRIAHGQILGIEKLFFDFDYADKTFVKKMALSIFSFWSEMGLGNTESRDAC